MQIQKSLTISSCLPKIALFAAAIIWGSSFFMVKNIVAVFPTNYLLAIRFTAGAALLAIVFRKKLHLIDRTALFAGLVVGGTLFISYFLQTWGIRGTTPGKNSFLTAIYCVLVPFITWAFDKVRPDSYNFTAAFLCILGIGLISLDGRFQINWGDRLSLLSGVIFAINIFSAAKFTQKVDLVLLTILQFAVAAICAWICGAAFEIFPKVIPASCIASMIYLSVAVTTLAYLCQNYGLKHEDPAAASIILSLESVFGVLFSVIFYHEVLTLRLICGFAVIFCSVIISETKLNFLRK